MKSSIFFICIKEFKGFPCRLQESWETVKKKIFDRFNKQISSSIMKIVLIINFSRINFTYRKIDKTLKNW